MRSLKKSSDQKLVVMLKQNNTAAFDQLYRNYVSRLDQFLKIYTKDQYLREEAIQEVFVKVWQKRHQLKEELSFKAFLFQTVKYQLFNIFRKKVEHLPLETAHLNQGGGANDTEDYLNYLDLQHNVSTIVNSLPEMQKKVFTMSRMDGLNNEEIARQLDLSQRTVEHHIYLALKYIKKKLPVIEAGLAVVLFLLNT